MGDPRKTRKKYEGPKHPWKKARIEEEKEIVKKYAPKNKKEIWKMATILKNFKHQAKKLSSLKNNQGEKETKQLLKRLQSMGLLKEADNLALTLIITLEQVMERRLQTLVFRKGLARSIKQARQFITHGHIKVNERVITSPSYLVLAVEEEKIAFQEHSSIANAEHPERQAAKAVSQAKPTEIKAESRDKKDYRDKRKRRKNIERRK